MPFGDTSRLAKRYINRGLRASCAPFPRWECDFHQQQSPNASERHFEAQQVVPKQWNCIRLVEYCNFWSGRASFIENYRQIRALDFLDFLKFSMSYKRLATKTLFSCFGWSDGLFGGKAKATFSIIMTNFWGKSSTDFAYNFEANFDKKIIIFSNQLLSLEIRGSLGQTFPGGAVRALHGRSPNATPTDFSAFWEVFLA